MWIPQIKSKAYMVHDKFDAALTAATTKDMLLMSNTTGLRRKVCHPLHTASSHM